MKSVWRIRRLDPDSIHCPAHNLAKFFARCRGIDTVEKCEQFVPDFLVHRGREMGCKSCADGVIKRADTRKDVFAFGGFHMELSKNKESDQTESQKDGAA